MNRSRFNRSARIVGVRVLAATGVTRVRRYVVRRRVLEVRHLTVQCRVCDAKWAVAVDAKTKRAKPGWRKCPRGCNAGRLSKG